MYGQKLVSRLPVERMTPIVAATAMSVTRTPENWSRKLSRASA